MGDLQNTMNVAASGMRAQGTRLRHVAENLANVDTPGYRRKYVDFHAHSDSSGVTKVETGPVRLDQSTLKSIHDPTHPLADETGRFDGSNVNTLLEVADSREAQRSYEANLRMFDQARQMTSSLLALLKR